MPDEMRSALIQEDDDDDKAWASEPDTPVVAILGSGDFSRSLTGRLLASGYQVVVGSRTPKRSAALFPKNAEVTSQLEAASRAEVVFVAVFPEHHSTLSELRPALARKILVDVSNGSRLESDGPSHAERLADIFPESYVVKGFNTVSAWALQTGPRDGSRQVFLCADNPPAKRLVLSICRRMGFSPVDAGPLSGALQLENLPLSLFPSWRKPVLATAILFIFFYLYNFLRDVLHPLITKGRSLFYKMPVETVNVTLPSVALVMLALVYAPGVIAAALQLWRGTKYSRFPGWLDQWMDARKQLGLCGFLCAATHAVYSLVLPMRKSARYKLLNAAYKQVQDHVEVVWDEEQVWRMELYLSAGILALGLLSLLAVTSLPSVANNVNWREFSFVQSTLGYCALFMSTLHTLLFGWDRAWDSDQYLFCLPPTFLLVLLLPVSVLLVRLLLLVPCLAHPLRRIRRGWERRSHVRFLLPGDDRSDNVSHV
ncbi:metalloreductase STEAP3-like [Stigmatopora nigra]